MRLIYQAFCPQGALKVLTVYIVLEDKTLIGMTYEEYRKRMEALKQGSKSLSEGEEEDPRP